MRNVLFLAMVIVFTIVGSINPFEARADNLPTVKLEDLIKEALKNNPKIKSAEAEYKAVESSAPQRGALPDPIIKFEASNIPLDNPRFDGTPMSGFQIGMAQKFPFPGKQSLAKRAEKFKAEALKHKYKKEVLDLIADIKAEYYQLSYIVKAKDIFNHYRDDVGSLVDVAITKYSVGEGIQQDVLKSQVELSKVEERLLEIERQEKTIRAAINNLLNRNPDYRFGNPDTLGYTHPVYNLADLEKLIIKHNPDIKALSSQKESASLKYKLAKKGYLPDFTLGAGYRLRDKVRGDPVAGIDFFSVSLSFNLPIYWSSKQDKAVSENAYKLTAAENQLESVVSDRLYELRRQYFELSQYEGEIELYSEAILPQAEQSLQSAQSGYQVGKVDFMTVFNNLLTLYNYRIAYYRSLAGYQEALAEIESLTGIKSLSNIGE